MKQHIIISNTMIHFIKHEKFQGKYESYFINMLQLQNETQSSSYVSPVKGEGEGETHNQGHRLLLRAIGQGRKTEPVKMKTTLLQHFNSRKE